MIFTQRHQIRVKVLLTLLGLFLTIITISLALAISTNINNLNIENFLHEKPSLPSIILDRNGDVISELIGVEKRTLLEFNDLPKSQIWALLTREDNPFFEHSGFSVRGFTRAVFKIIVSGSLDNGGGSTLTQQLAKIRLNNTFHRTIFTKLEELWETWQIERQYSKQEIMMMYLNKVNFGHGAYGIEAISRFFFNHSAKNNSVAESVMCAIQMARPTLYSPYRNPNGAKKVQRRVLTQMVQNGYITDEQANKSFAEYWTNHDWSRDGAETVHDTRNRDDKAPWFTEYIREEVKNLLFGTQDMYKDGYVIHTTLDLDYQAAADRNVLEKLTVIRKDYAARSESKKTAVYNQFTDVISMIGLISNIKEIKVEEKSRKKQDLDYFNSEVVPNLRTLSLLTGISSLNNISQIALKASEIDSKSNIETGLITIDNKTGQILALIGGSKFEYSNQNNRALNARVSPGSSFKPLYFSAGISSNQITPATHFTDKPKTFTLDGSTPYTPSNYGGHWRGDVLLRYALNKSLNIPAIEVLQTIGFDAAIDRSAALLGITDPGEIRRRFPRNFPLALGTVSVSPAQMAKAYATFANSGKTVDPYGIKFIENQKGAIIINIEDEMQQKLYSPNNTIMSPQDAYIMTNLLETTITLGTLHYGYTQLENGYDGMAMAGKTGTSDNWKDSWTVGYSPYVTTSLWYGFDGGSSSLGQNNNGAVLAGLVWSKYMKEIHKNLPKKEFYRPSGIIERTICSVSGDLKTQKCPTSRREVFKAGTEPSQFCTYHSYAEEYTEDSIMKIMDSIRVEASPENSMPAFNFDRFLFDDYNNSITTPEEDFDDSFSDILD